MNNQATQEKLCPDAAVGDAARLPWGAGGRYRRCKYTADELIRPWSMQEWDERHNRRLAIGC